MGAGARVAHLGRIVSGLRTAREGNTALPLVRRTDNMHPAKIDLRRRYRIAASISSAEYGTPGIIVPRRSL